MFVKIVKDLLDDSERGLGVSNRIGQPFDLVVPQRIFLYECEHVIYRKVRFKAQEKMDEFVKRLATEVYFPFGCPSFEKAVEYGGEFVMLQMAMSDGCHNILMVWGPCPIYVMSDNGKTVDTIHCA